MRAEHFIKRFLIDKRNGRTVDFSIPEAPTYHKAYHQIEGSIVDSGGRSSHIAG